MGRLLRGRKAGSNARSVWKRIEKRTGVRPSTHKLKRKDTKMFYQWEVVGRKRK